ncbi:unnamed protein product [Thlaspi arvense]|uniref:ELM2 domain-containing protein n=1 Tax=Thlaspi arvense TaxID=13288 RepID=A0AAU9RQC4_THLAR|nr:unnamed protein product [Thlaspi arvense]
MFLKKVLIMDEENNLMEESCEVEFVCGDPKVDIRVGEEYQAEIPPTMSESKRAAFLPNFLDSDLDSGSSCSFVVGLPLEVMWIDTKYQGPGDDNVDMSESLKSLRTKRNRRGESEGNGKTKQTMNLKAIPEKPSSSWEDFEVDGFVLGLYTFGKNFTQVKKFLESKETGEILSFYYGKFYKSAKYKTWSHSLKKRSRRCIQGKKLYSGWRIHQLLSRLIPNIDDETHKQKLMKVSKSFAEGNTSLEDYIGEVKELVGLKSLVEAVAIGKEKEDLTVLTTEPVKSKQWFTVSSSPVAAGLGAYTSLTPDEIVEKLSGGSRLSKARCNDIFWEAVWPRLLARGWHSEQSKDRGYSKSRDNIVFLIPGVKKFSRRKLVKQSHYFDSISDILKKVVSEPELLEFETVEIKLSNGFLEENIRVQEKRRYLKSPDSSSTHMKFTVVDTTSLASGGKLCAIRELKNLNQESLASQENSCQGDNNSSVERFEKAHLDAQKRAKLADEPKWEKRRMKKLVDEPMRFLIVDTSVDHGLQSLGLKRWRHLPSDENLCKIRREDFGDSSKNQSGGNCEYHPNGTDSGVYVEPLESLTQGRSKKRSVRKPESNNHHSVSSSLPCPKRRRLSDCVRKDIKRSGESSLLVGSMNIKTEQVEETGNGIEIQERPETEPNGLCSKQEALHESNSSEQEQEESNRLCSDKKSSSMDLETAQQQEKPMQLPSMSVTDKKSPSTDHETTQEVAFVEEKGGEQNQESNNTDLPRRQSTRKRPLTTRALEALESGFFTEKSLKSSSKPRRRERSTKIKNSASATRTRGKSEKGFHVKETTESRPLDQVEDSESSFLVSEATVKSEPADQIEDSKKVTTELPKRPPIVLKIPFKRG